ncbi:tat pathway signal sequence protein [Stemphylium lycopersici]|nr:tat pathway signal sequence protein [Stemphylium lycopersici]
MAWAYSPLYNRSKVNMADYEAIHATIGLGPNASEFRGKPNPEVDTAWVCVKRTYLYPMTKEEVLKMGNDPECVVLMPEEMGFGKGHHAGFTDVEQNINCLDVLRKQIYSDYYSIKNSLLLKFMSIAVRSFS